MDESITPPAIAGAPRGSLEPWFRLSLAGHGLPSLSAPLRQVLLLAVQACEQYRQRRIGITDLKAAVWRMTQTVVAVDESDLRRFLQWAEGQLDMLQFTSNEDDLLGESSDVVRQIEGRIGVEMGEANAPNARRT